MINTPPCKDCERRTVRPNCHATCAEYKEFVECRNNVNTKRREDGNYYDYIKKRVQKDARKR